MQQIRKNYLFTWLLTVAILLCGILLVSCNSDNFSVTMITTNGGEQTPPEDSIIIVVTVPATENVEEHQYNAPVPTEGKDALTLLKDMGKAVGFPVITANGYVESIDGVAQFAQGAESGWLYLVNGKMPSVSADQYIPEANDVINWIYLTSYDQLKNFEPLE
ncbi:MAG: DUF4430 domain-containing protein [Peptococcaceae bacterium]|nr:DUF4430 domain-containing protein [Peptococcaceae bacterium]